MCTRRAECLAPPSSILQLDIPHVCLVSVTDILPRHSIAPVSRDTVSTGVRCQSHLPYICRRMSFYLFTYLPLLWGLRNWNLSGDKVLLSLATWYKVRYEENKWINQQPPQSGDRGCEDRIKYPRSGTQIFENESIEKSVKTHLKLLKISRYITSRNAIDLVRNTYLKRHHQYSLTN